MTEQLYVQCTMQSGNAHDVAWIEDFLAEEGRQVKFAPHYDEVWTITTVGTVKLPWSQVNERSRDWKHTRKASDI